MRPSLNAALFVSAVAIAACTGNQTLPTWPEGGHGPEELAIQGPVLIQLGEDEEPEDDTPCLTSGTESSSAELWWPGGTAYNVDANEVIFADGRTVALAEMVWIAGYARQAAQNIACRTAVYQGRVFDVVEVHLEDPIVNPTATPPSTRP